MKTTNWVLTFFAIFIVSIGVATEKSKMSIVPMSNKKAIVTVGSEKSAYYKVTIEDCRSTPMYRQCEKKQITSYRKIFDFSKLEAGNYVMKVRINNTSLSQEFEVTRDSVIPAQPKLRYDPYFSFNDSLLKFSYLNFDKEDLKLNICCNFQTIFEKELGNDFVIADGLNLSKLKEGEYRVTLYSLNNEFYFDLYK